LEKAIKQYRSALQLAIESQDTQREAWVLNNLAFAHARQGRVNAALDLCQQAEALWLEIDFDRGLGGVYEVYGEAYSRDGQFDEALDYYQKALNIFEPREDEEWLARIYAEQGRVFWLQGELGRAQSNLDKALGMRLGLNKPMILHYLGHVCESLKDTDKAEQSYQESYEISQKAPDAYFALNSLGDLARLAVQKSQFDRLEEFEAEHDELCQGSCANTPLHRYHGLLFKYLGDLALGARPDDVSHACQYYLQGFPNIAKYESYEPFKVRLQLEDTDKLLGLCSVTPEQIAQLGNCLWKIWQEKEIDQGMAFILHWRQGRRVKDAG